MTLPPGCEIEGGFSRRTLGWVIGIAVASFLAALLLSAFGEELGSWSTPDANTFSYSAIGHRALADLLTSLGLGVVSRQARGIGGISGTGPRTPLVLAEPDVEGGPPSTIDRMVAASAEARRTGAPLVLVLPKWRGEPGEGSPGWVGRVSLRSEEEVERVLGELREPVLDSLQVHRSGDREAPLECGARWTGSAARFEMDADYAQLLGPAAALEPVVACGDGLLVGHARSSAGPEIFVIADPDVLNNQGLGRGDHAALVGQLFLQRLEARGVVFDETIHGFIRSRGLLAEAFRLPLLPAVLQAFVLLGIVLWAGMGRFGKPLPAPGGLAAGKDVLIDNTASLLGSGGHAADSVARYHRQTVRTLAAALFLPADLPDPEVRRRLEEVSRRRGLRIDLESLEGRIEGLGTGPGSSARALEIAGRLYRWRREMMDGQRGDS